MAVIRSGGVLSNPGAEPITEVRAMETTADERARVAAAAWGLAKRRGDERLRAVALADYRDARRAGCAGPHRTCRSAELAVVRAGLRPTYAKVAYSPEWEADRP